MSDCLRSMWELYPGMQLGNRAQAHTAEHDWGFAVDAVNSLGGWNSHVWQCCFLAVTFHAVQQLSRIHPVFTCLLRAEVRCVTMSVSTWNQQLLLVQLVAASAAAAASGWPARRCLFPNL
jgi:hypothetical protein